MHGSTRMRSHQNAATIPATLKQRQGDEYCAVGRMLCHPHRCTHYLISSKCFWSHGLPENHSPCQQGIQRCMIPITAVGQLPASPFTGHKSVLSLQTVQTPPHICTICHDYGHPSIHLQIQWFIHQAAQDRFKASSERLIISIHYCLEKL